MEVISTAEFLDWAIRLKDHVVRGAVASRIARARGGNLGNSRSLGGGLNEMKIDHGPGYRIYFTYDGDDLVVLLLGGDKSSQERDIGKARRLMDLKEWRQ